MRGATRAVTEGDRRRLRRSALLSALLWAVGLPLVSLIKYEGPQEEPTMNPLYVELEPAEPTPPPPPAPKTQVEKTQIAEKAREAPAASKPAPTRPAATKASPAAPAAARAPANLRPDPSAAPIPTGSRQASAYQTRSTADQGLSEESLRAATPPKGSEPSPIPRSAAPGNAPDSGAGDPNARTGKFSAAVGAASSSLAQAPASGGVSGGTGTASTGARTGARTGGGDLTGSFDFGPGPARELLSSAKVRVPDSLLAGLPNSLATTVSFTIEKGGTVLAGTIRFDPPLPEKVAAYLKAAFSSWYFSFAESDGQVVFRYSIKVR